MKIKAHTNLIEDSADSLYLQNTELFKGNGKFEIWSLPKILGTFSGGVLLCKNIKDYHEIKNITLIQIRID